MGLETFNFISSLNENNPVGATDPKSQGDDHLRGIKHTILATFPNITGAVNATQVQLNYSADLTGVTGTGNMVRSDSPTFTTNISGPAGGLTGLNASALATGTVPDARFPATLPAASGANLTALNATQITTGTLANARLSSTVALRNVDNNFSSGQTIQGSIDARGPGAVHLLGNTTAGSGSNGVLSITNTVDADCVVTLSQVGAPSRFARIGPSVGATDFLLHAGGNDRVKINSAGVASYLADNGPTEREIGFRGGEPRSAASPTVIVTDKGRVVNVSSGNCTVTQREAGFLVTIFNASGGTITLLREAGLTLITSGTTTDSNKSLPANGLATIYWFSATYAVVSGPVT